MKIQRDYKETGFRPLLDRELEELGIPVEDAYRWRGNPVTNELEELLFTKAALQMLSSNRLDTTPHPDNPAAGA